MKRFYEQASSNPPQEPFSPKKVCTRNKRPLNFAYKPRSCSSLYLEYPSKTALCTPVCVPRTGREV